MAKPTRLLLAIGVSLLVIMRVHFSTAQNVEPADDRGAGTFADGPGADADADDVRGRIAANRALAGPSGSSIRSCWRVPRHLSASRRGNRSVPRRPSIKPTG